MIEYNIALELHIGLLAMDAHLIKAGLKQMT